MDKKWVRKPGERYLEYRNPAFRTNDCASLYIAPKVDVAEGCAKYNYWTLGGGNAPWGSWVECPPDLTFEQALAYAIVMWRMDT